MRNAAIQDDFFALHADARRRFGDPAEENQNLLHHDSACLLWQSNLYLVEPALGRISFVDENIPSFRSFASAGARAGAGDGRPVAFH